MHAVSDDDSKGPVGHAVDEARPLLATFSFEMLPQAAELASLGAAVAGFALGFLAVYGFDLFVNRGRRSGIDEDDLRWALTEGAVVPEDAIEAIRVLERFSFVELDAEHADRVVDRLDGTKLKGRQVRVELARG